MTQDVPSIFAIPQGPWVFESSNVAVDRRPIVLSLGQLVDGVHSFEKWYFDAKNAIAEEVNSLGLKISMETQMSVDVDASRDQLLRVQGLDRVRTFLLKAFAKDLDGQAANQLLGKLIEVSRKSLEQVRAMRVLDAMDLLETSEIAIKSRTQLPSKRKPNRNGAGWTEGEDKCLAALTKHHDFDNRSCLVTTPIKLQELQELAKVSKGAASEFFKKRFISHKAYRVLCRNGAAYLSGWFLKLRGEGVAKLHYNESESE